MLLALGLVALAGTVFAIAVLKTAAGRAWVVSGVTALVAQEIRGSLTIEQLETLAIDSAVMSVRVRDPEGFEVLSAEHVELQWQPLALLATLAFGFDDEVIVPRVRVRSVEAHIGARPSADGWRIAAAFEKRQKEPSEPPRKVPIHWRLPSIEIERAVARIEPEIASFGNRLVEARFGSVHGAVDAFGSSIAVEVGDFDSEFEFAPTSGTAALAEPCQIRGHGKLELRLPDVFEGTFNGRCGESEIALDAAVADKSIDVTLSLPEVSPQALRAWFRYSPIETPLRAQISLRGTWPEPDWYAELQLGRDGPPELIAQGVLTAEPEPRVSFELDLDRLDLRELGWPGPPTAIGAELDGSWSSTAQDDPNAGGAAESELTITGQIQPGVVWNQPLPSIDVQASSSSERTTLAARASEPGVTINATVDVLGTGTIEWNIALEEIALEAIRRIPHHNRGRGKLAFSGTVSDGNFAAVLQGNFQGLDLDLQAPAFPLDKLHIDRLQTRTHATGVVRELDDAHFRSELALFGIDAAGYHLESARLSLEGRLRELALDLALVDRVGRRVELDGKLLGASRGQPELRRGLLTASDGQAKLSAELARVAPSARVVDVSRFTLDGLGQHATGRMRVLPSSFEGKIDAQELHLGALSRLLDSEQAQLRGTASLHAELIVGTDVTRGSLTSELNRVSAFGFGDLSGKVSANLQQSDVHLSVEAAEPIAGKLAAEAELRLAGSPLEAQSYERATGHGRLRVQSESLEPLSLMLGKRGPVAGFTGKLGVELLVNRPDPDQRPTAFFTLSSAELGIDAEPPLDPSRLGKLGIHLGGACDFERGSWNGTALVVDQQQELLVASAVGQIPEPFRIGLSSDLLAIARSSTVDAVMTLGQRTLDTLPLTILPTDLTGNVAALLQVRGTLGAPHWFATVTAAGLRSRDTAESQGAELELRAAYHTASSAQSPELELTGTARREQRIIATFAARASDFAGVNPRWQATAGFSEFPLELFPTLASKRIVGRVDGRLSAGEGPSEAQLEAKLSMRSLKILDRDVGALELDLKRNDRHYTGYVALRDPATNQRSLEARLSARAPRHSLAPHHARAELELHGLSARVLEPVLSPLLKHIDGFIQGAFQVTVDQNDGGLWSTSVTGNGTVNEGTLHLPALGLTLRNIGAFAVARSKGNRSTLTLNGIEASARTARAVKGDLELAFEGSRLDRAEGQFEVDDLPLTVPGAQRASASGNLDLVIENRKQELLIGLGLNKLHLELPRWTDRNLVELGAHPEVHVRQEVLSAREAPRRVPLKLKFELGKDVEISRGEATVGLQAAPIVVDVADHVRPSGTIALRRGGRIPLLGRILEIQSGHVTLNPNDAANPDVDVTSRWRAPDGTLIFVRIEGPWKENRPPKFWSDPPLSEAQVIETLLGGTPADQASGGAGSSVAVGGAVALSGVNELFGEQLSNVELRVDAPSETTGYAAAAAVRLAPELWFETKYVTTTGTANPNTDQIVTGTLDYRFARRWSLRTALGTAGGTLDLLWRYQY